MPDSLRTNLGCFVCGLRQSLFSRASSQDAEADDAMDVTASVLRCHWSSRCCRRLPDGPWAILGCFIWYSGGHCFDIASSHDAEADNAICDNLLQFDIATEHPGGAGGIVVMAARLLSK